MGESTAAIENDVSEASVQVEIVTAGLNLGPGEIDFPSLRPTFKTAKQQTTVSTPEPVRNGAGFCRARSTPLLPRISNLSMAASTSANPRINGTLQLDSEHDLM